MISQAQGILSKTMGSATSPLTTVKSLAGAHPIALGVVLGIGAYYAVNKYWLNQDDNESEDTSEKTDATTA